MLDDESAAPARAPEPARPAAPATTAAAATATAAVATPEDDDVLEGDRGARRHPAAPAPRAPDA